MRKTLIILLLLLLVWNSQAQVARVQNNPDFDFKMIHFGFTVGLNTMDFGIRRPGPGTTGYFADVSSIAPGFQVSIVSELRLGEYFGLRFLPGITFGQRTLNFFVDSVFDTGMQLESNFLDFPLLIKYKSKRVNNYRPYFVAGANVRYDLAARKDYEEGSDIYVRLKPFDIYFEIGFGVDFYLQYFKFSPELKLSVGMRDVLVDDPAEGFPQYVNSIDRLNSYVVMLCFHFE